MPDSPEQFGFPHILSGAQFTPELLKLIYALSQACRRQLATGGEWPTTIDLKAYLPNNWQHTKTTVRSSLRHHNAVELAFYEPSTRTRTSFGHAVLDLDGKLLIDGGVNDSSLVKGESLGDHWRILLQNHPAMIVVRTSEVLLPHRAAHIAEDYSGTVAGKDRYSVVINAGDGTHEHPTQAVLDAFTLHEALGERLHDCTILLTGDLTYSRTINSLLLLIANCYPNIKIRIANPVINGVPRGPSTDVLSRLTMLGIKFELCSIVTREQFETIVEGVDVVYSTRPQVERWTAAGEADITYLKSRMTELIQIDQELIGRFPFLLFHPLPRTEEIDPRMPYRHPQVMYFKQASNGVPTRMALMILALCNPDLLQALGRPVPKFSLGWAAE